MNRSLYKMFSMMMILALMLMALPMQSVGAAGTISLTGLGDTYLENFDTLVNSGNSSTVPNGWDFSESGTAANTLYTAGTGSLNTGDTYSFGATGNTERAFGGLRSGSLVPTIGAQFTNNTGEMITSLNIAYTGEQWRAGVLNRNAADRIDFQLSTNATSLTTGTWVDQNDLDFNSPNINTAAGALDGNASGNRTSISFTISGLNIANGSTFWIRWTDFDISSSDDGLAVDDFSLTPNGGVVTAADPKINEFSASTAGTDVEYVEIYGDPSTDYSAYTVLEIEGDAGTSTGTVDEVIAIGTTDANGLYLVNLPANALENGTITLLLVQNFTGTLNADLDTDNDGTFDTMPWDAIVDAVAVNDGGAGDLTYGVPTLGVSYDGAPFAPGGASRIPDGADTDTAADWVRNDFDLAGIPGFAGTPVEGEAYNTPGEANEVVPPPAPQLVINEIDYDQPSTDTAEYVEIRNNGSSAVSLSGWTLELVNGSGGGAAIYNTIALPAVNLAAGDYFVVCANAATVANCDLDSSPNTDFIQNGAPDAVGLRYNGDLMDAVSYEGNTGAPYTEGSGTGLIDDAVSATQSISRCPDGADTNQNNVDFVLTGSTPGAANDCEGADPQLTINDVSLNEGNAGTTTFSFTVSLSAPAGAGGVTFDIATADNTATVANNDYTAKSLTGQTITSGNTTFTFDVSVNGDVTAEPDETFFVNVTNVTGAILADGQGQGTIVNDDGVAVTFIHDIQTNDDSSAAGTFTVEAIVVGDYQTQGSGQLRGFFIQEEDADVDADPATSEGIFVFCTTCPVPVSVGDKVRVTGASSEFFNMTQLTASTVASVTVLSSGNPLPTPATIQLPVPGVPSGNLAAATTVINAYFEAFEGMLVTFPDTLAVSEYFELARYGQVILNEGGRPHTFTAVNTPTAAGLINHQIDLASRKVILDDTDNRENRPVDVPNTPYYHPVPGLSTSNFFRGGDTITNLTGVLHWSFAGGPSPNAWRIRPVTEAYSYAFTPVNTRPAMPSIDGRLTVASFNVLNYFLTIDTSNTCAPTQNQDCRGADSLQELERQRTKMLAALAKIDADVFGFMEMENTPNVEPLADIVAGLPGYSYIDTGVIGTDAIRVGIIYKTSTVTPVGDYAILDSSVDPRFVDTRNRPALAQTFEENATGARFTVVVNHLKSKGSGCGPGDDDTTTGQGNCNGTRTLAAQALADWLATDPTGSDDSDVLIIGDLNSYAKEDPIVALQNAGYTDLVAAFGGATAYGYVFDGQLGYLDHALSNASLTPQVSDVAEWHINADEIPLFDYNDDQRTADEAAFEEESDSLPLYEPNEFRTSDHDPVIIGLNLSAAPVANDDSYTIDEDTTFTATAPGVLANDTDVNNDPLSAVLVSSTANGTLTLNANGSFTYTPAANFNGQDSFTYKANDGTADSNIATVTITVNAVNDNPVATDDTLTVRKNGSDVVFILVNDFDVDGDTLTVTSFTQPSHGSVDYSTRNKNFRYTPKKGFTGTDTFTYTISDGNGGTATATVVVTVQ